MTGQEALDLIALRFGNRTQQTFRNAALLELKLKQQALEEDVVKPWFLLEENSTTVTVAGEPRVAVPSNFLLEYEEGALYLTDPVSGEPIQLDKDDKDFLVQTFGIASAQPEAYALSGQYFELFPTPDAAYTLSMRYYKRDTAPSDSTNTNLWLTHAADWLIAETCAVIAMSIVRDMEAVPGFLNLALQGKARVFTHETARAEANVSRAMSD